MTKVVKIQNSTDRKNAILDALRRLPEDPGWKVLVKILEGKVKVTELKLHGEMEWDKEDTLELLQAKRRDRVALLELPETIIKDYSESGEDFSPDLDPFE